MDSKKPQTLEILPENNFLWEYMINISRKVYWRWTTLFNGITDLKLEIKRMKTPEREKKFLFNRVNIFQNEGSLMGIQNKSIHSRFCQWYKYAHPTSHRITYISLPFKIYQNRTLQSSWKFLILHTTQFPFSVLHYIRNRYNISHCCHLLISVYKGHHLKHCI